MFAVFGIDIREIAVLAIVAALAAVLVWPGWRVCSEAGFPGPLGLVVLVPGGVFILLGVLAFADWPTPRDRPSDT
jgi:hypothetical protein